MHVSRAFICSLPKFVISWTSWLQTTWQQKSCPYICRLVSLLSAFRHFGGTHFLHPQGWRCPEGGGCMFLWNAGVELRESTLHNNPEDHRSYLNSAINGLEVAIFFLTSRIFDCRETAALITQRYLSTVSVPLPYCCLKHSIVISTFSWDHLLHSKWPL
jgi:hypothetical protein